MSRCAAMPTNGPSKPLEIAEHRIAENLVARADVAARRAALLAARRQEIHELVRRRHAQLAQQHLLVDREDRRVDAEAERQRRDDDDREHAAAARSRAGRTERRSADSPPLPFRILYRCVYASAGYSARSATTGSTRDALRAGQ